MKKRTAKKIIRSEHLHYKRSSIDKAYTVAMGLDCVRIKKHWKQIRDMQARTDAELAS